MSRAEDNMKVMNQTFNKPVTVPITINLKPKEHGSFAITAMRNNCSIERVCRAFIRKGIKMSEDDVVNAVTNLRFWAENDKIPEYLKKDIDVLFRYFFEMRNKDAA